MRSTAKITKRENTIFRPFNMIEILLAMGVIMLGLIGVLSLMPVAMQFSQDSKYDAIACEAAANIMEFVKILHKNGSLSNYVPYIDSTSSKNQVTQRFDKNKMNKTLQERCSTDEWNFQNEQDSNHIDKRLIYQLPTNTNRKKSSTNRRHAWFEQNDPDDSSKAKNFGPELYYPQRQYKSNGQWIAQDKPSTDFNNYYTPKNLDIDTPLVYCEVLDEVDSNGEKIRNPLVHVRMFYTTENISNPDFTTASVTRVFIEISWPFTVRYKNRQKRMFIMDFPNQ